jgi:ubiquinone biosynthesis protein UbiJ
MLTMTLENLLNRGLPRSPRARELCLQLAGKSLAIEVRDITRLRLSSTGSTLALSLSEAPAEASLSGGPLALLRLLGGSPQELLQRGAVVLGGDTHLAQSFRELLTLLRPDPEEELSLFVGDVPAHQLARLARAGLAFGRKAATTAVTNAAEYLGHERAELVPRSEGEQFLRGVDAVRENVDRLQARLELLARRRGAP